MGLTIPSSNTSPHPEQETMMHTYVDPIRWTAVVAVDEAWAIGKDGDLPWRLPDDLKHFARVTKGGILIMGRKTHESIGRALPRRRNIVLTRQPQYKPAPGCEVAHSESELRSLLEGDERERFVIGGASIYEACMPWTSRVMLTVVDVRVEGADVRLEPLNPCIWRIVESSLHPQDERHAHAFVMHTLERKPATDPEPASVPDAWRFPG